ncbi:NAD-dependent epimerase/dehydratase family protein [Homoserinibacter sp. YIM 151385]|uniref:NAD-dependent epimerase/dehydratase family protein n=1 Tax=Homoserinibacter sp. YIM 151385 TaxID=2985506 RepID=UPI0022F11C59|nr:NAD(P)-dependent oxidoreductase [Homoserinibacter sp. YIM 151385]WBU38849.1 NAD(P)-dependent oxidoreductase [Homoserinibacter sp. YIM 151385]
MAITAVITGGSGEIASLLRPRLLARGWRLRLLDTAPLPTPAGDGETAVEASILDDAALDGALAGADLLVHLAAFRAERAWADILSANIDGTRAVLEAAVRQGVRRVLLASSIHAVGFAGLEATAAPGPLLPRPDSYYGVSKAALEALGSVFADQHGLSVVSARIVNATAAPDDAARDRVAWFSPDDAARLVDAVSRLEEPGHRIVWGVSAGGAPWFDLGPGRAIGYEPQDDASRRGDLEADLPEHVGHPFTRWPLGEPMD